MDNAELDYLEIAKAVGIKAPTLKTIAAVVKLKKFTQCELEMKSGLRQPEVSLALKTINEAFPGILKKSLMKKTKEKRESDTLRGAPCGLIELNVSPEEFMKLVSARQEAIHEKERSLVNEYIKKVLGDVSDD